MTLTIELNEEERRRLMARAGGMPLELFVREVLTSTASIPMNGFPEPAALERVDGRRTLIRRLASLSVADRQPVLNEVATKATSETEYDRDWVDLDEDYDG